jgi:glycerol-3-phosphate dehydrogenase
MPDLGTVDLLVIGGGVNGAGIARDAVGRGLSVVLCEKGDLAEGTSSRSGKLVHGGLRYLEYYEFRLVREALIEREVLLEAAPHIIWPMRFVLPHSSEQRPAWMLWLGLFLYDHLGGRRRLPGCHGSICMRRRKATSSGTNFASLSNTLTAGSMMHGWSYSMRWTLGSVVLPCSPARPQGRRAESTDCGKSILVKTAILPVPAIGCRRKQSSMLLDPGSRTSSARSPA